MWRQLNFMWETALLATAPIDGTCFGASTWWFPITAYQAKKEVQPISKHGPARAMYWVAPTRISFYSLFSVITVQEIQSVHVTSIRNPCHVVTLHINLSFCQYVSTAIKSSLYSRTPVFKSPIGNNESFWTLNHKNESRNRPKLS